jgi:hypothetical protein
MNHSPFVNAQDLEEMLRRGEQVSDLQYQMAVLHAVSRLVAQMDVLMGNGKKGRIQAIEDRVRWLEVSGFVFLSALVIWLLTH